MEPASNPDFLASEETLENFLAAFFDHTLPKARWTHAAHVALAAHQLFDCGVPAALPRVRVAIRAFNEAVGGQNTPTSGYHETLTVFWLKVVAARLAELRPSSRLAAARAAVADFGEARSLHTLYYGHDIVRDTAARQHWIEPDLQPL